MPFVTAAWVNTSAISRSAIAPSPQGLAEIRRGGEARAHPAGEYCACTIVRNILKVSIIPPLFAKEKTFIESLSQYIKDTFLSTLK
jgi:hypothetical protein